MKKKEQKWKGKKQKEKKKKNLKRRKTRKKERYYTSLKVIKNSNKTCSNDRDGFALKINRQKFRPEECWTNLNHMGYHRHLIQLLKHFPHRAQTHEW